MTLLSIAGAVVFVGVLVLSLVAVLDVALFKPNSKRGRKARPEPGANARTARKQPLASQKSNRRS
jgi:hypothetical protein